MPLTRSPSVSRIFYTGSPLIYYTVSLSFHGESFHLSYGFHGDFFQLSYGCLRDYLFFSYGLTRSPMVYRIPFTGTPCICNGGFMGIPAFFCMVFTNSCKGFLQNSLVSHVVFQGTCFHYSKFSSFSRLVSSLTKLWKCTVQCSMRKLVPTLSKGCGRPKRQVYRPRGTTTFLPLSYCALREK